MSVRQAVAALVKRLRYPSNPFLPTPLRTSNSVSGSSSWCGGYGGGEGFRRSKCVDAFKWAFISGQAVLFLGMYTSPALADNLSVNLNSETDSSGENLGGFRKVEDGSVLSNIHTSKWRIYTDVGRERFLQGKLEDAERLFQGALQEAKEGFGERDPHVASACNNLAELYRVKKDFDKAEPLYSEAISVLEESFGSDDIRVGAALHNLGQFYLVQRKLEEACVCYERALKIKKRVLGEGNPDYADTMFHLGTVLYLQGNVKDSEALVRDSIRILEDAGQGESSICIKRLRYLAQMYLKCNRHADAENIQRKILQKMELSKGWNSLDTVIAAERLALTLESVGRLKEVLELLERCLTARKTLLSEDHIQIAANLFHIARVEMQNSNQLKETCNPEAIAELEKAKNNLGNAIRIAQQVLDKLMKEGKKKPRETTRNCHEALMILMSSLDSLGMLEITKMELVGSREDPTPVLNAKNALHKCVSAFIEFGPEKSSRNYGEAEFKYRSCSKRLSALLRVMDSTQPLTRSTLQELKNEMTER